MTIRKKHFDRHDQGRALTQNRRTGGEPNEMGTPLVLVITSVVSLTLTVCPLVSVAAENSYVPAHGAAIVLFDEKDLSNFDSFLKTKGLNSNPEHVFTVENGVIHISGSEFGYLITKREFDNYYLRAEFKWGEADARSAGGRGA
jgi:hypothetical protein